MKSSHFANTQLRHDYCYSQLSPALSTIYSHDNQSQHLFGDLVPTSDYLETFDNQSGNGRASDTRRDYAMHECNNNKTFSDESASMARSRATATATAMAAQPSSPCSSIQHDGLRHLDKSLVSSTDSDQLRANIDIFE